jgi:ATP-dependent helicase/DNAse subunit B
MALTLVTGPANSAKAQVVLDAVRAAAPRDPLLVCPTRADVDHYRAELARDGIVFGPRIVRFSGLIRAIAQVVELPGEPLSDLARERVVVAAIAEARLDVLAESATTPGFPAALGRLVSELEAQRVEPPRFTSAVRAWAAEDRRRRAYADEVGALYARYRRLLEASGRLDPELHAGRALDQLRLAPAAWGATPVFIYGFDELTPLQVDAVETLARVVGAPVTVSLSYEAGRRAFAGRTAAFEALRPFADQHVALPPRAEHYSPAAREALHHLERWLFEGTGPRAASGDAVRLIEASGERAELDAIAEEVVALLEAGMDPSDVAVAIRSPGRSAALLEEAFGDRGIPYALETSLALDRTAPGRALMGLVRCALLDGSADDLLAWLRAPGLLDRPELADALEAEVRRTGVRGAARAREIWERDRWPLDAIERLRRAARDGPAALLARLADELGTLLAAPWRRAAAQLDPAAAADAQAVGGALRGLEDLSQLAATHPRLAPEPSELPAFLAGIEVAVAVRPAAAGVQVVDPLAIRGRRVRALYLCGLQEGVFPRLTRAEPFFGDEARRQLARASGLVLPRHEDALDDERYLFYAVASRPEEILGLSWRTVEDDGTAAVRSFFVDDVREVFREALWERRRTDAVSRPAAQAPSGPIRPIAHPAVLAELRERPAWSASSLELWAGCPVKWFVERWLAPVELEPDPEPLVRGAFAHSVLETTLRRLAEETGSARLTDATLPAAQRLLATAMAESEVPVSVRPARHRAAVRRLEADLQRYLEDMAACPTDFEPTHLELSFGFEEGLPPLELDAGEVKLRGRIDRVDTDGAGHAIVYDYKGRRVVEGARWGDDRAFQVALYMLAVRELLGLEPVGGLYQPLGAADGRPRGVVVEDVDERLACVPTDRRDPQAFAQILEGAVAGAVEAAREARDGTLEPRPATCAWEGGCAYPSICRCEGT